MISALFEVILWLCTFTFRAFRDPSRFTMLTLPLSVRATRDDVEKADNYDAGDGKKKKTKFARAATMKYVADQGKVDVKSLQPGMNRVPTSELTESVAQLTGAGDSSSPKARRMREWCYRVASPPSSSLF